MNQPVAKNADASPLECKSVQRLLGLVLLGLTLAQLAIWSWNAKSDPSTFSHKQTWTGKRSRQHNLGSNLNESPLIQIDINRASSLEISLLPGVGPVLARRIVRNRSEHGPFQGLDDLQRVHGIGRKKIADIAPICVASSN